MDDLTLILCLFGLLILYFSIGALVAGLCVRFGPEHADDLLPVTLTLCPAVLFVLLVVGIGLAAAFIPVLIYFLVSGKKV